MNLANLRDSLGVAIKLKESIFKNNNQIKSTVDPEHGFCQQNGPEHGQLQGWYPDEEIVVVPICLNGRCCFSRCEGIVSY